ncbi:hypothetical protein JOQ06_004516 [Pogonophryne albipinna]|uniref:Uncharacterized protein n=1 Tax=Pogonophryne albipinna TaxID=1090488 RepID=A0AAD6ANN4_9TELE|nr:hypothetical protein JOQ06_004516 [Pogonophryne albipinna]
MLYRNMPACNLLLSGAIHFSGCMATQTIRMLKLLGLQCISVGTFFRHQRLYIGWMLDAAAKERECEDLKLWRPAIINHLYWTAASTPDGDSDVMEDKWQSMVNHVQDIHEHGTPAFPCCAHPPLEGEARDKEWLEPGTTAAIKLERVTLRTALVKDVRKLSPQHQTYSLEAFNSLILHFAPKHTGFSFLGMYSRLLMAALHFNHNSSREVARTSDGEVRYAVRYPRFCKGGWVVRPIKEKPSYAYAAALMESLSEGYSRSPETLRESSAEIAKDEAVGLYLARHSQFNTGN